MKKHYETLYSRLKKEIQELKLDKRTQFIEVSAKLDYFQSVDFLNTFDFHQFFYYKSRDERYEFIGIGELINTKTFSLKESIEWINSINQKSKNLLAFGGINFHRNKSTSFEWNVFSNCQFVIPKLLIKKDFDNSFSVHLFYFSDLAVDIDVIKSNLLTFLETIQLQVHEKNKPHNHINQVKTLPQEETWHHMVEKALQKIKNKEIDKIVLSRKKIYYSSTNWDYRNLLCNLIKNKEPSNVFIFRTDKYHTMIGRTPEYLFQLQNKNILIDAIAGTRKRGSTESQDYLFEKELITSEKELKEHEYVSQNVVNILKNISTSTRCNFKNKILKLKSIQHIYSQFSAELEEIFPLNDLIDLLHPTPAVGGTPKKKTIELIYNMEAFDRGWYAAPIGWFNQTESEFFVGIRSALIERNCLHVFAGAGIVKDSHPTSEWEETESKMKNFLEQLNNKVRIDEQRGYIE